MFGCLADLRFLTQIVCVIVNFIVKCLVDCRKMRNFAAVFNREIA